jgi:hypothetical protein
VIPKQFGCCRLQDQLDMIPFNHGIEMLVTTTEIVSNRYTVHSSAANLLPDL